MHFGTKLKYFRTKAGLTQAELADMISIAQNNYSRLEKLETLPKQVTIERLSKALDLPIQIWLYPKDSSEALDLAVEIMREQEMIESKSGNERIPEQKLKDYADQLTRDLKKKLKEEQLKNEILTKQLELEKLRNQDSDLVN